MLEAIGILLKFESPFGERIGICQKGDAAKASLLTDPLDPTLSGFALIGI
jgi:hypothetical protein